MGMLGIGMALFLSASPQWWWVSVRDDGGVAGLTATSSRCAEAVVPVGQKAALIPWRDLGGLEPTLPAGVPMECIVLHVPLFRVQAGAIVARDAAQIVAEVGRKRADALEAATGPGSEMGALRRELSDLRKRLEAVEKGR